MHAATFSAMHKAVYQISSIPGVIQKVSAVERTKYWLYSVLGALTEFSPMYGARPDRKV